MRVLLVVLALATLTLADVTRPAYLGLTETGPGQFDVVWRAPRRGGRVLAIRARLPEVFRTTSAPTAELAPGVETTRWKVQANPWELPGAEILIEGPGAARVDTMVRFQFEDGTVVARVLPPGDPGCTFPRREVERGGARVVQGAALHGLRHVALDPAHLILVLALALAGRVRVVAIALGVFALGQVAGALIPVPVPVPFVHALLAVAGAVLAAAALRPGDRRPPYVIAGICGLAHGAALAAEGQGGPLALFAVTVGVDAASLLIAMVAVLAFRPKVKRLAAYAVGSLGVALALQAATASQPAPEQSGSGSVLLQPVMSRQEAPSSAPVARATDAPLQIFVDIGAYETRVEWVASVANLAVADGPEIAIEAQDSLKRKVEALIDARATVSIDGQESAPVERRIDFVTREPGAVLERPEPVVEQTADALVGVVRSFMTREPPRLVEIRWQSLPGAGTVPATIVDPENVRTTLLSAQEPVLRWSDSIALPPVNAVAVKESALDLPLLSFALVALGLFALIRRRGRGGGVMARLLLAAACLAAPFAQASVTVASTPTPASTQASGIVEALLTNVYRSFERREENAVYDGLALSVTGDELSRVFLEQRRALELGRRGGARARVDSVEVVRTGEVTVLDDGRVGFEAAWDVGGFVVHFGHRHFRQNRYRARIELVADQGDWKIGRLEILSKERTR